MADPVQSRHERWATTREVVDTLGLSISTLRRLRDQEVLKPGVHFFQVAAAGNVHYDLAAVKATLSDHSRLAWAAVRSRSQRSRSSR